MRVIHLDHSQKGRFNQFVLDHPLGSIHQTYDWGLFQKKISGRGKFWALAVIDKQNEIRATALLIRQKLPFGLSWVYCPRGPLVSFNTAIFDQLMAEIKVIARQSKAVFLRIDPYLELENNPTNFSLISYSSFLIPSFRPAHANYQPEWTIKLDLTKTEEQLLKDMRPKGRYNIALAKRHGLTVKKIGQSLSSETALETFYQLLAQTTARDQFSAHPKDYYQALIETISPLSTSFPASQIYLAYYQNLPLAAIIVTFFKDTATYYFGASSNEHRQVMAPYLLHLQAILDAKKAGYRFYDLFGIAPESELNHPWRGVTEFKKKFGGTIYHYAPAQEYVFKPFWYWLMKKRKGKQ